jgi:carboxypeptidase T
MKFNKLSLAVVLLLSAIVSFAQQQRYDRLLIHLDESHTIRQLAALGLEVDHGVFKNGISFTSDFSATEEQAISAAGFAYDVLINDVAAYYVQQNARPQAARQRAAACGSPAGYNVQTPVNFHGGSMGGFLTYPEMLDELDSMHAKYPNLISARNVIDTFHSIEGRPIYWMRISNHPDSDQIAKPQILYTALHHAREPAGLTDMMFYMWYLLENYNTSAEARAIVDNTEMYIVPCVNPDGYIYNHTTNSNGGGMWRKNRRLNADNTYGVDLNRNYGYNWGYDNVGSSNTTTDETYRGTSGFSEPEISAVKFFAEHHNFKIAVNYHTYSNMLIYPWGYQASFLTPDSSLFVSYAKTMTKYNGFVYGTGDQTVGYTTNGDSDDWMYGEQVAKGKIFSMTPESGSAAFGFWPPASEVTNVARENFDLIYYAHKFLLRHLEVKDISPRVVLAHQFQFKYEAQRLGLDSPASYTVHLVSSDPNVTVPATMHNITNPALLSTVTDSFFVQLNSSIVPGSNFTFEVVINNGLYTTIDTIVKKYISGDTIYYNDCNTLNSFTSSSWDVTTASYTSPTGSITDSRLGNYSNSSDTRVLLNDQIDLSAASSATLLFQTKWALEKGYDYVLVEASSDNGVTWNELCGQYTNIGSNQNNSTQSLYDGFQNNWVQEVMDLGSYVGHSVYLRFHLVSDPGLNFDGFYFDDLTVLGTIDSSLIHTNINDVNSSSDWQIYPNPAVDKILIRPSGLNGETVTIYDQIGAVAKKAFIRNDEVDLSGLASGAYSLTISKEEYANNIRKLILIK